MTAFVEANNSVYTNILGSFRNKLSYGIVFLVSNIYYLALHLNNKQF